MDMVWKLSWRKGGCMRNHAKCYGLFRPISSAKTARYRPMFPIVLTYHVEGFWYVTLCRSGENSVRKRETMRRIVEFTEWMRCKRNITNRCTSWILLDLFSIVSSRLVNYLCYAIMFEFSTQFFALPLHLSLIFEMKWNLICLNCLHYSAFSNRKQINYIHEYLLYTFTETGNQWKFDQNDQ